LLEEILMLPTNSNVPVRAFTSLNGQQMAGPMVPFQQMIEALSQYSYAQHVERKRMFGREQYRVLTYELGFTGEQAHRIMKPMVKWAVEGARWAYRAKAAGMSVEWLERILRNAVAQPNPYWYLQTTLMAHGGGVSLPWDLKRWHEVWGFLQSGLIALKLGLPGYDVPHVPVVR
jgi:hypothetical protein